MPMHDEDYKDLVAAGIANANMHPEDAADLNAIGLDISGKDKEAMGNHFKPQQTSEGQAALIGAQQSLSLGNSDELGGLAGMAMEKGADVLGMGQQDAEAAALQKAQSSLTNPAAKAMMDTAPTEGKGLIDLYKEYRDMQRGLNKSAGDEHPWQYTGGALAGGFLLPGAALGQAGKAASIGEQIGRGISVGVPMGTVAGAGNSEHNPIGEPGQFIHDMIQGAEGGVIFGAGIPIAKGVGGATLAGAKALASPVIKGFKQGLRGNNLLGDAAERAVQEKIIGFGKESSDKIIDDLNGFGKLKTDLMDLAKQMGVKLDANEIDDMIVKRIDPQSFEKTRSQLQSARREMETLKELMSSHKEGPEVDQVKRVFYGDKPTQMKKFEQLLDSKQKTVDARFNPDAPIEIPSNDVSKFDKIVRQKQAEEQLLKGNASQAPLQSDRSEFENMFKRKQMEVAATPGQHESAMSAPLEMEYHPMDGSDNQLGIIKQRVYDVDGNFIGYKKIASKIIRPDEQAIPESSMEHVVQDIGPNEQLNVLRRPKLNASGEVEGYDKLASKVLNTKPRMTPEQQPLEMIFEPLGEGRVQGIIREPILDEAGNIVKYKVHASRAMAESEAAKFKDITERVRAGGKDLTDIDQFNSMLKDLNEVGQYGGTPFQSQDASTAAGKLYTDGRDMLRNKVDGALREEFGAEMPTLQDTDNNISALKKSIETLRLGDNTVNQSIQDKQKAYEAFIDLINRQELVGASGAKARQRAADFVAEIRKTNPAYADQLAAKIADLGEQASVSKVTAGITDASKLSGIKRSAVAAGNVLGLGANKIVTGAQNLLAKTPEEFRVLGQKFLADPSSKAKQELGRILSQLPDKSERERNMLLVGILMNPAYREWLSKHDEPVPAIPTP